MTEEHTQTNPIDLIFFLIILQFSHCKHIHPILAALVCRKEAYSSCEMKPDYTNAAEKRHADISEGQNMSTENP